MNGYPDGTCGGRATIQRPIDLMALISYKLCQKAWVTLVSVPLPDFCRPRIVIRNY